MKFKDWIFLILGTAILVALVILIAKPKNNNQEISADNLVGKPAPDFTLPSNNDDSVTLSKLKGKNVILFFNEGIMCYPSCWNQIAAFAKDTELKNKNTVVLSIVLDSKDKWQEAMVKMPDLAGATILLDTDKKVSDLYGMLNLPSSMHRGQFPGHSYVIIDKNGVIRFVNDDPAMAIRNKELMNEISSL